MDRLRPGCPVQTGEGSSRKMMTAAIPAKMDNTRYSLRIKVFAPSLMSAATSLMRALVLFWRRTHKNRYAAKANAMRTENREMTYIRERLASMARFNSFMYDDVPGIPGYKRPIGMIVILPNTQWQYPAR